MQALTAEAVRSPPPGERRYNAGMRSTMTCPKCSARKIWRIEKFRTESDGVTGWPLHVVYGRRLVGRERVNVGHFDCYVCATCGYSELYAAEIQGLVHNPAEGVTFWDGEKLTQGPMR